MKKLALLMGSLLVVGATASAKEVVTTPVVQEEPKVVEVVVIKEVEKKNTGLRATAIAQTLGYENWEHSNDNTVYLTTKAEFAYGANNEWTGYLEGRKDWKYNEENETNKSSAGRVQLSARRNYKFTEGTFSVGPRWRGYNDHDRLYADMSYSYAPKFLADYGIALSGYFNPEYRLYDDTTNNKSDRYGIEMMPATIGFGKFRVGYYLNGYLGTRDSDYEELIQQIRAYLPIWKNDKWSFDLENRLYISKKIHNANGSRRYGINNWTHEAFSANRTYLKASYKATPKLTLAAAVGYEYGKWNKTATQEDVTGIYKEATLGFSYKI